MPRTEAQNEWRKSHKQIFVQVAVTEETKAMWKAYADAQGLPVGTMIRRCIQRCIEQDAWNYSSEQK